MLRSSRRARVLLVLAVTLFVAACGGAPATVAPPTPTAAPAGTPTSAPTASAAATQGATGPANLDAVLNRQSIGLWIRRLWVRPP